MGCPRRIEGMPWEGPSGEHFPGFDPAFKNDDIKASRATTGAPFFARGLAGTLWEGQGASAELSSWASERDIQRRLGLAGKTLNHHKGTFNGCLGGGFRVLTLIEQERSLSANRRPSSPPPVRGKDVFTPFSPNTVSSTLEFATDVEVAMDVCCEPYAGVKSTFRGCGTDLGFRASMRPSVLVFIFSASWFCRSAAAFHGPNGNGQGAQKTPTQLLTVGSPHPRVLAF